MKFSFRSLISILICLQVALGANYPAMANSGTSSASGSSTDDEASWRKKLLEKFRESNLDPNDFEELSRTRGRDPETGKDVYIYKFINKNDADETVEIKIPVATHEEIEATSPQNLRKNIGQKLKESAKHAVLRFPMESLKFQIAIGAVNYLHLASAGRSNNPLINQQLQESFTDPVAHTGFLAFMTVNGVSAAALNHYFKLDEVMNLGSPQASTSQFLKIQGIQNFSMTLGSLASTIVSEIAYLPYLKECALSKTGFINGQVNGEDFCQKAWGEFRRNDQWIGGRDGGRDFAAAATSLILGNVLQSVLFTAGRTVLTSSGMQIAKQTFRRSVIQAIKSKTITGQSLKYFKMVLRLPGDPRLKAVGSFIGSVVVFAAFIGFDQYIFAEPVRWFFNNTLGGVDLKERQSIFLKYLAIAKKNGWYSNAQSITPKGLMGECTSVDQAYAESDPDLKGACPNGLEISFERFSKGMIEWRDRLNMEVANANANWVNFINTYSTSYDRSEKFYRAFFDAGLNPNKYPSLLQTDPLRGIDLAQKREGVVNWDAALSLQLQFIFENEAEIKKIIEEKHRSTLFDWMKNDFSKYQFVMNFFKNLQTATSSLKKDLPKNPDGQLLLTADSIQKVRDLFPKLNKIGQQFEILNAEILKQQASMWTDQKLLALLKDISSSFSREYYQDGKVVGVEIPSPLLISGPTFVQIQNNSWGQEANLNPFVGLTIPNVAQRDLRWGLNRVVAPSKQKLFIDRNDQGQFLLASMLWGPEPKANAGMVVPPTGSFWSQGFQVYFKAPRIIRHQGAFAFDFGPVPTTKVADLYQTPFYLLNWGQPDQIFPRTNGDKSDIIQKNKSVFEYLANRNNLIFAGFSSIEEYNQWWTANVKKEFEDNFKYFETEYQSIVQRFRGVLNAPEATPNLGPASNSLLRATKQEVRLYLSILGDLYKHTNPDYNGSLDPQTYQNHPQWRRWSPQPEVINFQFGEEVPSDGVVMPPIIPRNFDQIADELVTAELNPLEYFKTSEFLDLDFLGKVWVGDFKGVQMSKVFSKPLNQNFVFQQKVLRSLDQVIYWLSPSQSQALTSEQFEKAINNLNNAIKELQQEFGINTPEEGSEQTEASKNYSGPLRSKLQIRLATKVIEALKKVSVQLNGWGVVLNSVKLSELNKVQDSNRDCKLTAGKLVCTEKNK